MKEKLFNLLLAIKYNFFKNSENRRFNGEIVFCITDFTDFPGLHVKNNEFYNNNDVWFTKDRISVDEYKRLVIDCVKNPGEHSSWQGTRTVNWESACVETDPIINYGTWEIRAKVPKGWPAIWLLREGHINKDGIDTITPEVDIMEVINGRFQHTIHHTPTPSKYSTDGANNKLNYDNDWHVFGVDLRKDGYDFYIDGQLTARFRGNKENAITDVRSYLIINGAVPTGYKSNESTEFIIDYIMVRKNEFTTLDTNSKPWRK